MLHREAIERVESVVTTAELEKLKMALKNVAIEMYDDGFIRREVIGYCEFILIKHSVDCD